MASDHHSMNSIRSAISRSSVSSSSAPPPQIYPLPTSKSFTAGSSLPAPSPPLVPPKDRLGPPMTPQRKPLQRQKSPLSSEAFSSPASDMPGAFPETPSPPAGLRNAEFRTAAYSENSTPSSSPDTRSSKRLSSMRNLLPFKVLRRSYDNPSPDSPGPRPTTPGADSMVSSPPRPTLRNKMSGTFWKRKSSLGMSFVAGEEEQTNGHTSRPTTNGREPDPIMEDSRPTTPIVADELSPTNKRKSGTFWRRKSSLTFAETMNAEKQGSGRKQSESAANDKDTGDDKDEPVQIEKILSETQPPPPPPKSYSPPPQLPEFIGSGGGLGLGEDLFKNLY
ncbi:MAG: hypothetical protein Q9217_001185 [Psora testacea]